MSKEVFEVLGRWASIAVILAFTLYGAFDIWSQQMGFSHQEVMTLIKENSQCATQ